MDEQQQSKPTNEIVKLVLNSNSSLTSNTNLIQVDIQMPVHLQKVYLYEAETQTFSDENNDRLSKDAGDEARLIGSNKYALLSLDEYQITRTGEEHCLKKYFSDDDVSLSDDDETTMEKQMEQMNFDEKRTVLIDNLNNNASTILHTTPSNLSNTLLFDDTTHLSATLAQSTSSRISHSRYLQTLKDNHHHHHQENVDQLAASTEMNNEESSILSQQKHVSSIRSFVRQAINSCRENLTLVNQLLENIPSYDHRRKNRRMNGIINTVNSIKGLQYYPSTSVQTE